MCGGYFSVLVVHIEFPVQNNFLGKWICFQSLLLHAVFAIFFSAAVHSHISRCCAHRCPLLNSLYIRILRFWAYSDHAASFGFVLCLPRMSIMNIVHNQNCLCLWQISTILFMSLLFHMSGRKTLLAFSIFFILLWLGYRMKNIGVFSCPSRLNSIRKLREGERA